VSLQRCLSSALGRPDARCFYYLAPNIIFVTLYSILPHKELRFIFPALPMFTLAGASGLNRLLPVRTVFPLSLLVDASPSTGSQVDEGTNKPNTYQNVFTVLSR
jgi:hypothetical protein